MEPLRRVTGPTVAVLRVLLAAAEPVWGLAVVKQAGLRPGTVYPILERLERQGWLRSGWELDPERSGPRRRLYAMTDDGVAEARRVCAAADAGAVRGASRTDPGVARA